jgi:general secretion pathway protein G
MKKSDGFSLMELMIVVAIATLIITIAVPSYQQYVHRAKVNKAIADIRTFDLIVEKYRLRTFDRIPNSLAETGAEIPSDPWGRPYQFLNISTVTGKGPLRKDGKLNPLNTDYDLYSVGADGLSAGPLTAMQSRDDIVRANNGAFVGLGEDY